MSENQNQSHDRGGTFKAEIYKKFVHFYSLPDPDKCEFLGIERDTKGKYIQRPTQSMFAKKFGVSDDTLSIWKKRENFAKEVDKEQMDWGLDKVGNVLASLYRRCLDYGKAEDVELFLAYYKGWDKKQVVAMQREIFSMDDLRALIGVLPQEKQEAFYETISNIITEAELARGSSEVQGHQPDQSGSDPQAVRQQADNAAEAHQS